MGFIWTPPLAGADMPPPSWNGLSQRRLLALDRDPWHPTVRSNAVWRGCPLYLFQNRVQPPGQVVEQQGLSGRMDGVLLDLGVSSPQLDNPARGFSFSHNRPLGHADPDSGLSAAEWLQQVSPVELDRVLAELGEERFHRRIARALIAARQLAPITTTAQLSAIVAAAASTGETRQTSRHRTFRRSALRSTTNYRRILQAALAGTLSALAPGGRLAVLSFHSLEDRMVKQFMREQARGRELPLDLPVMGAPEGMTLRLVERAIRQHR